MIAGVIRWSARNSFLVLLATAFIVFAGIYAVRQRRSTRSRISLTRK